MDKTCKLFDPKFKNDEVFKEISRDFVSLEDDDIKTNNRILKKVILDQLIGRMRRADEDFDNQFQEVMYGGSFYKGLKVSEPDEYDLMLVMNLPVDYDFLKFESDRNNPGYVRIKLTDRSYLEDRGFWRETKILDRNGYLSREKFHIWIQSVVNETLNHLAEQSDGYLIKSNRGSFRISCKESGPAFTIHLEKLNKQRMIDFDLVPCLYFENKRLPGFRKSKENKWIAVAKPLKSNKIHDSQLWRASFYFDEKELLKGPIKPIIRMVKFLRDVKEWTDLKSYFIEQFFLHLLNKKENLDFTVNYESASRTALFMYILRRLLLAVRSGKLFDYWNRANVFDGIDATHLRKIANELQKIIGRIDCNIGQDEDILFKIFDIE